MAEDWPWDKEDHQGFACELWPSHSIYPAEDFEATECQERGNSCCRSHGLWCLWRIAEEKKAKAGEIAKPVWVQQAHSGGHHVCQGQPWHYVFFSQHRGWCHGFSGGMLPWGTTRTSCITCGCQTLYKFLELLGRFATFDAGRPWKGISCQLRWLSQDLRSWARSYASWSTLERRKVWESRRPLERPMEEDRSGGKCFWAWRRSPGNLHRHSGSQFFPSFQWLCTNPMGTWGTRSSTTRCSFGWQWISEVGGVGGGWESSFSDGQDLGHPGKCPDQPNPDGYWCQSSTAPIDSYQRTFSGGSHANF